MITPDSPLTYKVDRLLTIFTAARDAQQQHVNSLKIGKPDGMGNWAAEWPGGNTRVEQACVDALQAWKNAGVEEIVADFVLADADPQRTISPDNNVGNIHNTFFMQLQKNQIRPATI